MCSYIFGVLTDGVWHNIGVDEIIFFEMIMSYLLEFDYV